MAVFLQPDDLWRYALPPKLLFGDAEEGLMGIEPGVLTPITHLGSGTGRVEVDGIARAAYSLVLRCEGGGEININEAANTGPLPIFSLSKNGGGTFGTQVRVSDNRDAAYIKAAAVGLRFVFKNGVTTPSFVVGDTYSLSSQPSPDIIDGIEAVEAEIFEAAAGSYDLPLIAVPPHWRRNGARLLRWDLLTKIGVSKRRDMQTYYPKDVYAWLEQLGDGRRAVKKAQGVQESAPGTSFPLLVPPLPDPLVPPV